MKDDSPFVFAGLWEGWKDPANGEWLHTCTIITGEPNESVRQIHTRMPVILSKEHHDAWLSGEADSHVYSEPDRRQQLIYQGKDKTRTWSLAEINDLAHRFENSSIALRDLMKEIWNI
jgi:putative SOS response-associated peptidase YedK